MNAAPGPARTVVVVDDDDDFREMFVEALRLEGIHVLEVPAGELAVALFDRLARSREQDPALLVLDLMMPAMSGIEVLQRVRRGSRWSELPVLVMTAVNDPMLSVRLDVPVVFKPDIEALLTAVRQNLLQSELALGR